MKPLVRVYVIALAAVLLLMGSLLFIDSQATRTREAQLQQVRDQYLLRNLRTAIENLLASGLQADQLDAVQQVIEREQAEFARVVAIDVFSANGRVLYSTDVGNRGMPAPQNWLAWLRQAPPWNADAPGQRQIGTPFENDLGKAAGGIAVTLSTVDEPATLAQWYERGQQALHWLTALVLAALATAGLVHGGLRHLLAPFGEAARALENEPASAGKTTPLTTAARARRAAWAAARQQQQQTMQGLEALDHED